MEANGRSAQLTSILRFLFAPARGGGFGGGLFSVSLGMDAEIVP